MKNFNSGLSKKRFLQFQLLYKVDILRYLSLIFLVMLMAYIQAQDLMVQGCVPVRSFETQVSSSNCTGPFVPDVTIGQNSASIVFASQIPVPPNWVGQKILINGTFIVDTDLSFFNCTVRMAPGAFIRTQGNVVVGAIASHFYSCEQMWRGFYLQDQSAYSFWYSTIEDAQYALTIDDGVTGNFFGNTLNRNYVGIRNGNAQSGQSGLVFGYFGQNTFTCTAPLNQPFNGQSPAPGNVSFAGFQLDQCVATIGVPAFGMNTFSNMRYGIYATQSSMTVKACRFEEMSDFGGINKGGYGIYALEGSLYVDGEVTESSVLNPCIFDSNQYAGIECHGSDMRIRSSRFFGAQFVGIHSVNNLNGEWIECRGNEISLNHSEALVGIQVERSVASGSTPHVELAFNKLELLANSHYGGLYGIRVVTENPALDKARIYRNEIEVTTSTEDVFPIFIAGGPADGFIIERNEVVFNDPVPSTGYVRWGIAMLDTWGFFHEVKENDVTGTDSDYQGLCGIHLDEARNVDVCDNYVDYTRRGLHLNGVNAPCQVRNNAINRHQEGLLLNDGPIGPGIIGDQIRHGNTWSTAPAAYTAWAAQCLFPANPNLSKFIVESNDPAILPPQRIPGGNLWFEFEDGSLNYCIDLLQENVSLSELDQKVAAGAWDSTWTVFQQWHLEKGLYYKLLRFPALVNVDSTVSDFFNNSADPSAAVFAQAEYDLAQALLPGVGWQQQLDSLSQTRQYLLGQLILLDAQASPLDSFMVDSALHAQKLALLTVLKSVQSQWENLRGQWETARNVALSSVSTAVNQLPALNAYEANQQLDLRLRLKSALAVAPTPTQWVQIASIAAICPAEGGSAVRAMQGRLSLCQIHTYLSDLPEPCIEEREGIQENTNAHGHLSVFPNPADEQVQVSFHLDKDGRLMLMDVNGRLLLEQSIPSEVEQITLPVAELPGGWYYLILKSGAQILDRQIIIIH